MTQYATDSNTPDDLIAVDDAAQAFGISRSTLFRVLDRHGIKKYRRTGDRRTYVSRAAVRRVVGFREV